MLGLLLLGVPVYLGLFAGAILLTTFALDTNPIQLVIWSFSRIDGYLLLPVPFFLLSGQLMTYGGSARPLLKVLMSFMGHIPGGPAYVIIAACVIFAALSTGAMPAIAGFGPVVIPLMTKMGYDKRFAIGLLVASAALGGLIPPSVPLILYGYIAGESVRTLYSAAFIPGFFLAFLLCVTVFFWSRRGYYTRPPSATWGERWEALKKGWPVMLMPVVILVPLYAGVVTATETSAIAAAYALLLGLVVYRELTWGKILHSFRWTVQICAMIFFIIVAADLLNKALVTLRVPFELSEALSSAGFSAGIFMLIIIIAYLLMGMFLDPTAILLISVPILLESVVGMGISPVVYGIVVTVAVQVACMTPPYGIDLFAAVGILKEPFHIVARGTFLFYPAMMGGLLILAYVPDITFALPRLFGLTV